MGRIESRVVIPAVGAGGIVGGTGTTNQVAIWNGTSTLTGRTGLTYDGTTLGLPSGSITASAWSYGAATFGGSGTATFSGNVVFGGRGTFGTNAADTILNFSSGSAAGLTGTSQYMIANVPSFVASTATVEANYYYALPRSTNNSGTTARVHCFFADTAIKGATDTWTRLINYRGANQTAGSTGNAFMADNVAFTGNWFINQSGTASSFLGGSLTVGGNTTGDSNLGTITSVSLAAYYVGSVSVTFQGALTTPIAKTINYTKIGRLVTLHIPTTSGAASNATTINISGTELPSGLRPNLSTKWAVNGVFDNSGADINSAMQIDTTGLITVYATAAGGSFTASGSAGWDRAISVSYYSAS